MQNRHQYKISKRGDFHLWALMQEQVDYLNLVEPLEVKSFALEQLNIHRSESVTGGRAAGAKLKTTA